MTTSTQRVQSVGSAKAASFEKQLEAKLGNLPGGGKPSKAFALKPAQAKLTRANLFNLLKSSKDSIKRAALSLALLASLRKALPAVFGKIPLLLKDFRFRTIDEFAQFLVERVNGLGTNAKSLREFSREESLAGLRWQLVGKVLFERLIKYHQGLNRFFSEWADEFRKMVNSEIQRVGFIWMLDVQGTRKKVTAQFRKPQKVVEFRLEGDDTVRPEFTDCGSWAENSLGDVLLMPTEIKLPAALQGVKEQIAGFKDRLSKAETLIAVLEDGSEKRIDPSRVVFDEASTHHIAVTLYTAKRWKNEGLNPTDGKGKRLFDVEPISNLRPVYNPKTDSEYYELRVTVNRDWLVDLVKLITDPK